MTSTPRNAAPPRDDLGSLLRYWRTVRGQSQLDVSLDAGISQRQISFIESGRSVPGRNTLLTLAQTLEVPLRERNRLLHAAGYAPVYSDAPWDAREMQSVVRALERVLQQHEPYPAVVMDRRWNVLMTNSAAPRFFNHFIDMAARQGPRNMLHLIFDPKGMRPFIVEWDNVARSLLQRVQLETVGHASDDDTRQLFDELLAYGDVPADWRTYLAPPSVPSSAPSSESSSVSMPFVPLSFRYDRTVLHYFSLVTTVGAPHAVAAQELRLESLFPADDVTEAFHLNVLEMQAKATARR